VCCVDRRAERAAARSRHPSASHRLICGREVQPFRRGLPQSRPAKSASVSPGSQLSSSCLWLSASGGQRSQPCQDSDHIGGRGLSTIADVVVPGCSGSLSLQSGMRSPIHHSQSHVWRVDDLGPGPVEDGRLGQRDDLAPRTKCDPPADRSPKPLPFLSGCASCSSRNAADRDGVAGPGERLAAKVVRGHLWSEPLPGAAYGGVPFHRSRPAPRPLTRRSGGPVPGVPADARPGRMAQPLRRLSHRVTTQSALTYLARSTSLDLRRSTLLALTLTVTTCFTYPTNF
jgi:hypothetical protein